MANKAFMELQSIERISSLPMVCSTLSLTAEYYEKIKVPCLEESNPTSRMLLILAENSVQKTASLVEPIAVTLEKPIKLADSVVCSTMDFVENRFTIIGDSPRKITNAITSLPVEPVVECAIAVASYGVQKINHLYNKINGENSQDEDEQKTEPDKCGDEFLVSDCKKSCNANSGTSITRQFCKVNNNGGIFCKNRSWYPNFNGWKCTR